MQYLLRADVAWCAAFAVVVSEAGCADKSRVEPRAIDISATAPAGDRPPCPVLVAGGGCRPVASSDVVTLARDGLVLPAAWFSLDGGASVAFGIRWSSQSLVAFHAPTPFSFGGETRALESTTAAAGLTVGGQSVLYFVAGGTLERTILDGGQPAAATAVELEGDGAGVTPSWVQAAASLDGRVLLTFVEPQLRAFVAVGEDAGDSTRFLVHQVAIAEPSTSGLLTQIATTTSGGWILTYHVADPSWTFHASAIVSTNGAASWGAPVELGATTADAFAIARPGGGADVYYTAGSPNQRVILRRALHDDGTTGAEQLVTDGSVGSVEKPQPRRLPDGRAVIMFTVDHGGGAEGDLAVTVLDGDAPW